MKVTRRMQDRDAQQWVGWHILTVAEPSSSMLDVYGQLQRGLSAEAIRNFAAQVNKRDQSGSLHPTAPISAVPRRLFQDQADLAAGSAALEDFKRYITGFIDANQSQIRASKVLVDFHWSRQPPTARYIEVTEESFCLRAQAGPIQELVIFT